MRYVIAMFLTLVLMALAGCNRSEQFDRQGVPRPVSVQTAQTRDVISQPSQGIQAGNGSVGQLSDLKSEAFKVVSESAQSQAAVQTVERKIIRNAELNIESDSPDEGQRKIASIAENNGGFVVTAESKQNRSDQFQPATVVSVIIRVPATKFGAVIEQILGIGGRILHQRTSGQDVTEEYIDLEARLRAKRALEAQFLEIMKRAAKVSDALEVQTQLTEVRTEIERIEGRRRFLENQAALSTITVTLHSPAPIVTATTTGFWHNVKSAFGDGVDAAVGIVLGIVRFVIVMIPILLLIIAPCWLALKWLRRRITWPRRPANTLSVTSDNQSV